mgnify:CR=1 FL=1
MHKIEPHFNWRAKYIADKDNKSPFYGRQYNEFQYTQKIYNYYIHPQWDNFGSPTLYLKILFADYERSFAIIELIGEWNDAINNDVMFLKRDVIDVLIKAGIHKYILIGENVLNFHGDDNCYYEEWWDDVKEEDGWIVFLNLHKHVMEEMQETQIQFYANFGRQFSDVNWRPYKPGFIFDAIEAALNGRIKEL